MNGYTKAPKSLVKELAEINEVKRESVLHFLDGYDQQLAKPWNFRRSSTANHPQFPLKNLAVNEPAFMLSVPKSGMNQMYTASPWSAFIPTVHKGVWYCRRNNILYKSVDRGINWIVVHTFTTNLTGGLLVSDSGAIFVCQLNPTAGAGAIIKRSVDGGTTFSDVLTMSAGAEARWVGITSEGNRVYIGDYGKTIAEPKAYRSLDDGATFETIYNGAGQIRHIHFVTEDPYTGHVYIACGDINAEPRLLRSKLGDGSDIETIGSGTQEWRLTDVEFDENYIYFGGDGWIVENQSGQVTGDIYGLFRLRRTDDNWEIIKGDFDSPLYDLEWDAIGNLWFTTSPNVHPVATPKESELWMMDKQANFYKMASVPMAFGKMGGLQKIDFDNEIMLLDGYAMGWQGLREINLFDAYMKAVRVGTGERFFSDLPNSAKNGGAFAITFQMPKSSEEYKDSQFHYLAQFGQDDGARVLLYLKDGNISVQRMADGSTATTPATTPSFLAGDYLTVGVLFGQNGVYITSVQKNDIKSGASNVIRTPKNLKRFYAGGKSDATNNSGASVVEAKVWATEISLTEFEKEVYQMFKRLHPKL